MPWDLQDLNPPTRYYLPDSNDQEWIDIRLASEEDNKAFFKAAGIKEKAELVSDKKTRSMQRITYFDTTDEQRDKFNEELWDCSIVNWNLLDPEGEKIPCTREMKCVLMRRSPKFAEWFTNSLEDLRNKTELYKVTVEKN